MLYDLEFSVAILLFFLTPSTILFEE